jgi:long-chain acyl-CoA synthetase
MFIDFSSTPYANALYRAWAHRVVPFPGHPAILDLRTGTRLSRLELNRLAVDLSPPPGLPAAPDLVPLAASGAEYLAGVLAIWREGKAVLPLEPGTQPPAAWLAPDAVLPPLPAGCALVKLTSGSTGTPRGVAFTAEQVMADARQLAWQMGLHQHRPNLCAISLAHSYGFSNLVTPLIAEGAPLILMDSPLPGTMRGGLAQLRERGIHNCVLPAVPALWDIWLKAGVFADGAAEGLVNFGISAGAPLPLELEERAFREYGLRIHNFYGASECGGIAYDGSEHPRQDARLAGRVIKDVTLSLNEDGLLQVRGPAVGQAYWPEPGPGLADGVYTSTDLAELGADGEVRILGRAGEMIHVAGRKLMPQEVEAVLKTHPGVEEALVFGVPSRDATRQSEIVAFTRGTATEAALRAFTHERLPGWKIPRHWRFSADLRADARGKLSRDAWRKRFLHDFPEVSG